MPERGITGGLDYRFENFPAAQQQQMGSYTPPQPVEAQVPEFSDDPLAVREKLTSDYYSNMGMLRSYATDMAKKGIDVFEPDYSQEGGGLAFQTAKKLEASVMYAANALSNEFKAEQQTRPYELTGQTVMNPNVDRQGLAYSDAQNFTSTKPLPGTDELNQRLAQETNDPSSQNRVNAQIAPYIQRLNQMVQQGLISPEKAEIEKQAIIENTYKTRVFSPYAGGGGANAGISAYVKKWSEIANGLGFQPGESFDTEGNRIDVSRPSEFAGRQLGFTADGKKFIIDRFEKKVQPGGDFIVEAVDATGKARVQVDPNNVVGSLRSFIETNEGAGALKDLNSFFRTQGFDTATQSIPAGLYSPRATDVSAQTSIAPKVTDVREKINVSLDILDEGGLGRFMKNLGYSMIGQYGKVNSHPTEIEFSTSDGRGLKIKRDGDNYKIDNYQEIFGKPTKGIVTVGGQKIPVVGNFEKIPKERLQAMLEKFGVINVMLKDSEGKEVVNEPMITPSLPQSDTTSRAAQIKAKYGL